MERKTMDTFKKVFGEQKLTGADAGVVGTLTALGPWGLALLAAYLAGQGLVQLVKKIQAMPSTPGAPTLSLTAEEETRIGEAIRAMQLEFFARAHPESMKEIESTGVLSLEMTALDNALANLIQSPLGDPNRKDLCDKVRAAMERIEPLLETVPYAPLVDTAFRLAYKWLDGNCGGRWPDMRPDKRLGNSHPDWK